MRVFSQKWLKKRMDIAHKGLTPSCEGRESTQRQALHSIALRDFRAFGACVSSLRWHRPERDSARLIRILEQKLPKTRMDIALTVGAAWLQVASPEHRFIAHGVHLGKHAR